MTSPNIDVTKTGIEGLDYVLGGGLPAGSLYLVRGASGTGKTTLSLQYLMEGARQGETVLYVGTSESRQQLDIDARAHGWSFDNVAMHHLSYETLQKFAVGQSIMHPADVELPQLIESILRVVEEKNPDRVVIDSLDEIRVIARELSWYRRQLFVLKEYFESKRCTVLLTEVPNPEQATVDSVVSGLIGLERNSPSYGSVRRRLQVEKLRAQRFESGYHDYRIQSGGLTVFPRLVAASHKPPLRTGTCPSGIQALDNLVGGEGLDRGSTVLFVGPAGTGKTTVAAQYAVAAAQRGEASAIYCFDERLQTFYQRSAGIGLPVETYVRKGLISVTQVDPGEMSAGEFSYLVRRGVEQDNIRIVMIDSLNGYAYALPEERFISVHLHELSSYLNQCSVTTLLTMAQHGIFGSAMQTPFEVSYISDTVFMLRLFEHQGAIHKAISVYKRRGGFHEAEIRQLSIGSTGIHVGDPMRNFHGVLTGIPELIGSRSDGH